MGDRAFSIYAFKLRILLLADIREANSFLNFILIHIILGSLILDLTLYFFCCTVLISVVIVLFHLI